MLRGFRVLQMLDMRTTSWRLLRIFNEYRRTSISGTKKAQIISPLRNFFPLKVVK
jgi:hypothetical protein